jgi:hypothetical protein
MKGGGGIDPGAVQQQLEMQMRAVSDAGPPDAPDRIALRDVSLAGLQRWSDTAKVIVPRYRRRRMADLDLQPRGTSAMDGNDGSVGGGMNPGPSGRG